MVRLQSALMLATLLFASPAAGRAQSALYPDDPYFPEQVMLNGHHGRVVLARASNRLATDTVDILPGLSLDAPAAWAHSTGSRSVVVALLDDGFFYAHPDIAPNIWVNPRETGLDERGLDRAVNHRDDDGNGYVDDVSGWDFAFDDPDPDGYVFDGMDRNRVQPYWHSISALGIIGARGDNGIGIAGINWEISMMLLKIGAQGTRRGEVDTMRIVHAARALRYAADNGARIVNWSGWIADPSPNRLAELREALEYAAAKDVLVVLAAGNAGLRLGEDAEACLVPGCLDLSWDLPNLIRVAELDWDGRLVRYTVSGGAVLGSNWSPDHVDIAAVGQGYTTLLRANRGIYGRAAGTSNAAPVVSGVAALVLSVRPDLTASQLKQVLLDSSTRLPGLEGKVSSRGVVNALNALRLALASGESSRLNLLRIRRLGVSPAVRHVADDIRGGRNRITG